VTSDKGSAKSVLLVLRAMYCTVPSVVDGSFGARIGFILQCAVLEAMYNSYRRVLPRTALSSSLCTRSLVLQKSKFYALLGNHIYIQERTKVCTKSCRHGDRQRQKTWHARLRVMFAVISAKKCTVKLLVSSSGIRPPKPAVVYKSAKGSRGAKRRSPRAAFPLAC
jgi:hypothetical protein